MTIDQAAVVAQSPAVWALCAILLTGLSLKVLFTKNEKNEARNYELHKEFRDESKVRESKMFDHLEKSNETLNAIANTLEQLDNKFDNKISLVHQRVDNIERMLK